MAEFERRDGAARLDTILPAFARKTNPVDLTGQIRTIPNHAEGRLRNRRVPTRGPKRSSCSSPAPCAAHLQANAEAFKETAREVPVFLSIMGEESSRRRSRNVREAGVLVAATPSAVP
jgi:acyl-CoA synthetase (NDP forming)